MINKLLLFPKRLDQAILEQSVEALRTEYVELENAFLTMLFGSLMEIRGPSLMLSLKIIEAVKDEISISESHGYRGDDVLGDLMASLVASGGRGIIALAIFVLPHVIITIGKGGVGKTTVSLLWGPTLSNIGRTIVLSLDQPGTS